MKNIFLADDDADDRKFFEDALKQVTIPTNLTLASDGLELMSNLETVIEPPPPDIIFLDINMPVMNGWQFLDMYQPLRSSLAKEIQVFLVTSSINDEDREFSRRYDCVQDYIVKPLAREKIREILAAAVLA